jgi:hypothetical protein
MSLTSGCTNPIAVNYNPLVNNDDNSCLYLIKHNGVCNLFKDVQPELVEDRSFTLSYSVLGNCWVLFHDYTPDMYIHTHTNLFSLKDQDIRKHHEGPPGDYLEGKVNPFFIDLTFMTEVRRRIGQVASDEFKEAGDMILEAVQWVTEYLQINVEQRQKTLTHITIWDSYQHSGRIALDTVQLTAESRQLRRTQGAWSFNDFRDLLDNQGEAFLQDLFNDYKLDPAALPTTPLAWYEQKQVQDSYFCIRFEFDNVSGNTMVIHDMIIQALKTDR